MAGKMTTVYTHDQIQFPVAGSDEAVIALPEIDFTSHIPTQGSVEKVSYQKLYCDSANLLGTSPQLVFHSKPSQYWTDLSETFISLEISLVRTDGKKIDVEKEKVSFCNFVAASLFKDLQIQICGKNTTSCFNNFYIENYLKVVLEQSQESMQKWRVAGLEDVQAYDQSDPTVDGDKGIAALYKMSRKPRVWVHLPVLNNVCCQSRFFPSLVDFKFIFTKNDPNFKFCTTSDNTVNYDIAIHQAYLQLKKVHLYPNVEEQLNSRLTSGIPMQFYIQNMYARTFPIIKGQTSVRIPEVFLNPYLPQTCYVGVMEETDLFGSKTSQNLSFQNQGVNKLYMTNAGIVYPLSGEFSPDTASGEWAREFFSLYGPGGFGLNLKCDYGMYLTYEMWNKHHCFYKFDFGRYSNALQIVGQSFKDQRQPSAGVDLHIGFSAPTKANLQVVIFTNYLESLAITSNEQNIRDVELGYSI